MALIFTSVPQQGKGKADGGGAIVMRLLILLFQGALAPMFGDWRNSRTGLFKKES
jgi:hypothetical protein